MIALFFVSQCSSKNNGLKEMHTLSIYRHFLPGEKGFPLNNVYVAPKNRQEEGKISNVAVSILAY